MPLDPAIPPPEVLAALTPFERRALRHAAAQNRGARKRFWMAVGRQTGARLVRGLVARQLEVTGWEHVERADHARPLLLLANHRTVLDFFVVSALFYQRARWMQAMHFPVRSRHCYENVGGVMINQAAACWSAFPPFFRRPDAAVADQWALDLLVAWCKEGPGRVVGFHPEGTRHRDPDDPWSLLPAQPGVGKLVHAADPQAIPVFITGLQNHVGHQMRAAWRRVPVRVRFGAPYDFSPFRALPARARTYVEIGRAVMARIAELAAEDRAAQGGRSPAHASGDAAATAPDGEATATA